MNIGKKVREVTLEPVEKPAPPEREAEPHREHEPAEREPVER